MNQNNVNEIDTSNTTGTGASANPSTGTNPSAATPAVLASPNKPAAGPSINVTKKDLGDSAVQKNVSKLNGTVNVVDETINQEEAPKPSYLKYLSNIKDPTTNEVAKPFDMNGKQYQMVRAINEKGEKVAGVYCLSEVNESGEHIIHPADHFEQKYVKKPEAAPAPLQETAEGKVENLPKSENKTLSSLNLGQYKFFFVNKSTGKLRKFKTTEALAKATLNKGEEFLSLSQFKSYMHSTLFGSKKKEDLNEDDAQGEGDLHAKAVKLMKMIATKIPHQAIETIKTSKQAQKEVILSFAEMIGVPRNMVPSIVGAVKDMSQSATDGGQPAPAMQESKVITKGKLDEQVVNNVKKTVKVKDIK